MPEGSIMQKKHNNNMIRRIVDVCMTMLLLFLMAYQVTGEVLHEWIGMGMTVLGIYRRPCIKVSLQNPMNVLTRSVVSADYLLLLN